MYGYVCAILCILSSLAIILLRKRELVATICVVTVCVLFLILAVLWVGLQSVILAFPGHRHLPFGIACDLEMPFVNILQAEYSHEAL